LSRDEKLLKHHVGVNKKAIKLMSIIFKSNQISKYG